MQALERAITHMTSANVERLEHSYERYGTQSLIANFDVATGKILSPAIQATRTEEDFETHIKQTIETDPAAK